MCHQSSCPCVTVEEDVAAEECLLVYCKPVELYNILQRRAQHNVMSASLSHSSYLVLYLVKLPLISTLYVRIEWLG